MSNQQLANRQPVEINASKTSPQLEIVWDDDHRTKYPINKLRDLCPCATCREAREKAAQAANKPSESTAATPVRRSLPLFKAEKYQIINLDYVGRYALGVDWQDDHKSIYPWAMLSENCPCDLCQQLREKTDNN